MLPTACLAQLLITLPAIVQKAVRASRGDESLRLLHALEEFKIELDEVSKSGQRQLILTLSTGGGFAVSFSAPETSLTSLCENVLQSGRQPSPARHLS